MYLPEPTKVNTPPSSLAAPSSATGPMSFDFHGLGRPADGMTLTSAESALGVAKRDETTT